MADFGFIPDQDESQDFGFVPDAQPQGGGLSDWLQRAFAGARPATNEEYVAATAPFPAPHQPGAPPFWEGAQTGLEQQLPQSLGQIGQTAAGMFLPFMEAPTAIREAYGALKGEPIDRGQLYDLEQIKQRYGGDSPEYQAAAGKSAGTILPQMAMLAAGAHGLRAPEAAPISAADVVRPELAPETATPAEPPPIRRVSPETGEEFVIDPKTGETIQPQAAAQTPDELTRQIAESPEAAAPGDIAPGQQPAIPPEDARYAGMGQPELAAGGETGGRAAQEPIGVAERYAQEELGDDAVIPGEGKTWEEARDFGQDYINDGGDPRAPIRVAQKSGRSGWKEVGIVSAEYERLGADKRAAVDALSQDPGNPILQNGLDAAESAQADWRREMQPVLTKASDALRAARGERVVDPSSYSDLSDLAIDSMGKNARELSPQERTALSKGVADYNKASSEGVQAADAVRQRVRQQAGGKTMSLDDLTRAAEDFVKSKLADCVT